MATAFDVAHHILASLGPMSAMKLQKLVYYSQAWSLVWDDAPLFHNRIEAWANGPVVRDLYDAHSGAYVVTADMFASNNQLKGLTQDQLETIKAVMDGYGHRSAQWLSDQTHAEDPWKDARVGLAEMERGNREITHASLSEYYSSLPA